MTHHTMPHEVASSLIVGAIIAASVMFTGCLGGGESGILYDEEVSVNEQRVATFPLKVSRGYVLTLKVELLQGERADFVFINESELGRYLDPGSNYSIISKWSTLDASGLDTQIYIDRSGSYLFMVDNTQRPLNGASPNDVIRAKVYISL